MISMISHSRKGKTMEEKKKKVSGCRVGVARDKEAEHRIFRTVKTLHGIRMIDSCQNTFIQTHRMFNTKNEL